MRRHFRALAAGLALAMTLVACGDGGDDAETDESTEQEDSGEQEESDDEGEGEDVDASEGARGPFRLGWVLSYLSPEYALSDLYMCSGGSNYFGYCNEDFDSTLQEANAADPAEADGLYQEAEDMLLEDLPLIPMWYGVNTAVWSDNVSNVEIDAASYVRVEDVEAESGEFTAYGCEPQTLIPQDSREVCGGRVLQQLFSGLAEIDHETNEPEPMVASSIEPNDDFTEWTIEVRDDFTFHNGDPVTPQSFVDSWNFGANPDNGFSNVDFYQQIEGFEDVQSGDAEELSGVEVDGQTITITLSESFSPFIYKLTDTAFYPLPEEAFDDIEGFQNAPIGNGRYQMDGEWERGQQIAMTRYEDWPGDEPGAAEAITWSIYSDVNTAYLDVQSGALDILEQIPPEQLVNYEEDFPENSSQTETSSFTYLGFPMYNEDFESLELRQALSLAIDREQIIDVIFNGAQTPATAIIPPVLDAYREDACDVCEYDPERAQELFEEAGGFDGTMQVYFNSGAGHDEWVEAVTSQWRDVLGIEDFQFQSLEFAQYLEVLEGGMEQ